MRIVLDMQGEQLSGRWETTGQETVEFVRELLHRCNECQVFLALSGRFPDTIEPIRSAFAGLLPQSHIRVWHVPGSLSLDTEQRVCAALIREAFLASFHPDVIHVCGLYEGYADEMVFTIGAFDSATPVSVIQHEPSPPQGAEPQAWQQFCRDRATLAQRATWQFPPGVPVGDVLAQWGTCGKRASSLPVATVDSEERPQLVVVAPMPPERTGIADYCAELLPSLARYYDIELVVDQERVDVPAIDSHARLRDVSWFLENAHRIGRVLYHMGNSPFHRHMPALLEKVPGVVVLHDFYLSGLVWALQSDEATSHALGEALYESHGYAALREQIDDPDAVSWKYPVNWPILSRAQGVIVHSDYSRGLAQHWFGEAITDNWQTIPLLRSPPPTGLTRAQARSKLGFRDDDHIVCSFGMTGPTKLNHRVLAGWRNSALARDARCYLVFVGENDAGHYGEQLRQTIEHSGVADRIRITGFVTRETFQAYLDGADLAVQLRTLSRGESSASILDCMNHGLPVVVNANGSIAELDREAVWMLPDEFSDGELIEAMEGLHQDAGRRKDLGERARQIIRSSHAPEVCAQAYHVAIERMHARSRIALPSLIDALASNASWAANAREWLTLAHSLATDFPVAKPLRRLFVDVSAICRHDLKTGIQRVVRALIQALLELPDAGYRIEPFYIVQQSWGVECRYARRYTLGLLGCSDDLLRDDPLDPRNGDVILGLDLSGGWLTAAVDKGLFHDYRNLGVSVYAVVYDLLPLRHPDKFPPGAEAGHHKWATAISTFDGALCISRTVAEDLRHWLDEHQLCRTDGRPYRIDWFHLGADVHNSLPSKGLPPNAEQVLQHLRAAPSFLMVGTLEPRKGHVQVLEAFEQLLDQGCLLNLVIVGKQGWMVEHLVERLRHHPEWEQHLFWLDGISDEYLEQVYAASTCLIAASLDEGFGLPLIEAAQHGLPIMARDIPVFREVAGVYAKYFDGDAGDDLAIAMRAWLASFERGSHPKSDGMPWLTWSQSAAQLIEHLSAIDQVENGEE